MSKTIDIDGGPKGWPPDDGGKFNRKTGGGDKPALVVLIAGGLGAFVLLVVIFMALSGRLGVASIRPGEVGVKVNYITGDETVITTPGFKIYIPIITEIFTFDRTTQEFLMQGRDYQGKDRVPRLTVRASDGSNFWFEELLIQYEIMPDRAEILLNDSGPGDAYKEEWIKAHARSILRDEFGRFSAVKVADPTAYRAAPIDATRRLNEVLNPHGIRIVRIITPNPKFDAAYEDTIETRKEANQEVEELIARADQLREVKEQRLAQIRKEKDVEEQELKGNLIKELRAAERDAIQVTRSADAYALGRRGEGSAQKAQLLAEARGLEARYSKEAEGIAERARALEERGEVVVREALIEKLIGISFTLLPYSRDAAPQRLEHVGASAEAGRLIDPQEVR